MYDPDFWEHDLHGPYWNPLHHSKFKLLGRGRWSAAMGRTGPPIERKSPAAAGLEGHADGAQRFTEAMKSSKVFSVTRNQVISSLRNAVCSS